MADINIDREFVLAGSATFTVHNGAGTWFTFHVKNHEGIMKVRVLAGQENDANKSYARLAVLDAQTGVATTVPPSKGCPLCASPMRRRTRRADNAPFWGCSGYPECKGVVNIYPHEAHALCALNWALGVLWERIPHEKARTAEIKHAGRCAKCRRKLTTPESLSSGYGPECSGRNAARPKRKRRQNEGNQASPEEVYSETEEAPL